MKLLHTTKLVTYWTPAQYTVLWFITGFNPRDGKISCYVEGKPWVDCHIETHYQCR
jgi:hypothetical protein